MYNTSCICGAFSRLSKSILQDEHHPISIPLEASIPSEAGEGILVAGVPGQCPNTEPTLQLQAETNPAHNQGKRSMASSLSCPMGVYVS